MLDFPLHTLDSAPDGSRAILAETTKNCGTLPNLLRTLAESPAALEGFERLRDAFARSSLTPLEQQVVYLTVSQTNVCHYCTTQISIFDDSEMAKIAAAAILDERPIPDRRLQALRRFATTMTVERGWVSDGTVAALIDAGFTRENILDIITGIALVTMSSYTNHIAATPIETDMERQRRDG